MYIIIAMANIWKEVFGRCKLLRAVFLIVDYAKFVFFFLIFDKVTNTSPIVNC